MAVFLDTSYYYALLSPFDEHHERANELFKEITNGKYGQIYTSNMIMSETGTLVFIRTHGNELALHHTKDMFIGGKKIASILRLNEEIEKETWDLFLQINHKGKSKKEFVSFVHCSNIILCQKRNISNILSFDNHFGSWLKIIH